MFRWYAFAWRPALCLPALSNHSQIKILNYQTPHHRYSYILGCFCFRFCHSKWLIDKMSNSKQNNIISYTHSVNVIFVWILNGIMELNWILEFHAICVHSSFLCKSLIKTYRFSMNRFCLLIFDWIEFPSVINGLRLYLSWSFYIQINKFTQIINRISEHIMFINVKRFQPNEWIDSAPFS